MNLSSEELSKVRQFGMLEYTARQICLLLRIDQLDEFESDLNDPDSMIYKSYYEGLETARFAMDKMLFEKAKEGDREAYDTLKESQRRARIEEIKKKLF